VLLALFSVYLIWGSTYLGMAIALESFPPFWLGAIRFLAAGALFYAVLRLRGERAPSRREWGSAALTGLLFFAGGNGLVAVGQQWVSSGLAAVIVASMPLWMAVMLRFGGQRLAGAEKLGLLVGFAGVALLHLGGELHVKDGPSWVIGLAPVAWASGSLLSRRLPLPKGAIGSAAQMLAGGAAMMVIALVLGDPLRVPSARACAALVYLVLLGSIVGFSAYAYLLRNTRPAIATSYAYVNPVIAIALGVAFGGERPGPTTWLASAVILLGVLLITRAKREPSAPLAPNGPNGQEAPTRRTPAEGTSPSAPDSPRHQGNRASSPRRSRS
jgi:drug/metabolite transporter (DMT)-like permease